MAGRVKNEDSKMQQDIYGRVDYHETPISAFNNERERIFIKNAIRAYTQLAELAEVNISHSMKSRLTKYIKDIIV